jgi:hypothetical protein
LQIGTWFRGLVPTYGVNNHKDRRDIRQQTADRKQTAAVKRTNTTDIMKGGLFKQEEMGSRLHFLKTHATESRQQTADSRQQIADIR